MIKSLKSQQRFKSECNNVYTKQINKISLSSNDDRRFDKTFDKIITYSKHTDLKVAIYSRSSIQNTNNRRFRILKNKFTTEFNRKPARHL